MDFKKLAFDASRCYLTDAVKQGTVSVDVGERILGWIRSRDVAKLSACQDYLGVALHTPADCHFYRQIAAMFKKNAAFVNKDVCKDNAKANFLLGERLCRITNKRLNHYYCNMNRLDESLLKDISKVEHICEDVLGDFREFLNELPSLVKFTSGATSTTSRRKSKPHLKVKVKNMPASKRAQKYLRALCMGIVPDATFITTESNRVETVPKNWKTDRTIACEPIGNGLLQLAFDGFVKKKLRMLGVNLSDQSKNQKLSWLASINDDYVTVDLSMASDTVALTAVQWLLPEKWVDYLTDARTHFGVGFNSVFEYAKFSSMGNGSTFCIETLIFASMCKAVTEHEFAVYGDDIVIHRDDYKRLAVLLKFFGFRINQDKSYFSGPFRESCGTDWFLGRNVTPFYLRTSTVLKTEMCHVVNGLASIAIPGGELAKFIETIVVKENLPLVPYQEDSTCGVWLDAHTAYTMRLIHTNQGRDRSLKKPVHVPVFQALKPKMPVQKVRTYRTYFLWQIDANKRRYIQNDAIDRNISQCLALRKSGKAPMFHLSVRDVLDDLCIIRSEVPKDTHKYVRTWVGWYPPATATPVHLFWWSEFLTRKKPVRK